MSTRAPSVLSAVLVLLAAGGVRGQGDDELTDVDRKVMKELTGRKETDAVVFHYRPDDFDEATLGRTTARNAENFARCGKLLDMAFEGRAHVFLYRDLEDLRSMTGSGAVAFSTGTRSVHQARDFDSVHEFVHIYAMQFPRDQDATTDGFVTEGLATALAEVDQGVPIHSWAAVDERYGRVPGLVGFRRTWPEAPAGVHPYHVAGSFVGWLVETQGITKVKRWYVNSTEAHMAFGKTLVRLEKEWRAWLDGLKVDPAHEAHVVARLGIKPMPAAYRKAKGRALFDHRSLAGLEAEHEEDWKVEDGLLVGERAVGWTRLHSRKEFGKDVGLRARFRFVRGKAVQLRLNRTEEEVNEAIFATWSSYLSLAAGGFAGNQLVKLEPDRWYEVVFVNEGGTGRVYLDGVQVFEKEGALFTGRGSVGLAVEAGRIEVKELVVIDP